MGHCVKSLAGLSMFVKSQALISIPILSQEEREQDVLTLAVIHTEGREAGKDHKKNLITQAVHRL